MVRNSLKKIVRSIEVFSPRLVELKLVLRHRMQITARIPHETDFRVLARFHSKPGEVLIDIGANRGQSIESMLTQLPDAHIVAFEPNPCLSPALIGRYKDRANIRINPFGLSDTDESLDLFVPVYRGIAFDSLASVQFDKASSWLSRETLYGFSPRHLKIERYRAQFARLDSLKLRPAFIKIDVQGTELNVVRGGLETIRKYSPAMLIESAGPDDPISGLLRELGYHCYAFRNGRLRSNEKGSLNSFLIDPLVPRFDPTLFCR